ncbi:MAG: thymidylate kinase [Candidatus Roizmanbacteria bacterium]
MKNGGKLIVIDGGDGSGKTVQAKSLIKHLESLKIPVKYVDFPQYDQFYGKIIKRFLNGEFGKLEEVSPYLSSIPYALDRASIRDELITFLNTGGYVIANRYATSNLAHQTAKIKSVVEKEKYINWSEEFEYNRLGIPREDIVIYLHVPWKISVQLTDTRAERKNIQKDIAESNHTHMEITEATYLNLTERFLHWNKISCTEQGKLLSKKAIHEKVIELLKRKNFI